MLFNSYLFLLIFLPLAVCGWFFLNRRGLTRAGTGFLLVLSLWFYAANDLRGLPVLLVSALVNWAIGRRLQKKPARGLLVLGVALNLAALGFFKYTNFLLENWSFVTGGTYTPLSLILPLGISFFTFQQVSFLVDASRGQAEAYTLGEYALFVSFFPYVMSGPIAFHSEIIPQLRRPETRTISWENLARGLTLIGYGLAKKVLIADTLGASVTAGWALLGTMNTTTALFVMAAYSFQLYFDFSGYCDIAAGAAKMLNIDLPRNFDSPYRACSIAEFWKRWHMTMTRFFTRYLYIPLGGSRRGLARTCVNTLLVFLVSGLWHGANWTFLVWGGLHGAALVLEKLRSAKTERPLPRPLGWLLTFLFVNCAWVFFRAPSLTDALRFFQRMLTGGFGGLAVSVANPFLTTEIKVVNQFLGMDSLALSFWVAGLFLAGALALCLVPRSALDRTLGASFRPSGRQLAATTVLLVWAVLSFTGVSTFLYFTF